MSAAGQNRVGVVKTLIPFEKRKQQREKWAAIHFAANNASVDALALLLEHEWDLTTIDNSTSLMIAAEKNNIDGVKMLCEKL